MPPPTEPSVTSLARVNCRGRTVAIHTRQAGDGWFCRRWHSSPVFHNSISAREARPIDFIDERKGCGHNTFAGPDASPRLIIVMRPAAVDARRSTDLSTPTHKLSPDCQQLAARRPLWPALGAQNF